MTSKDDIIADLRQQNADQAKRITELLARVAELELQLAKATKDSSNSSKSPSSDIVKPPGKKTDRRKTAKRGGQKGHAKQVREPLPPDRVDEQITYEIDDADIRDRELTPTDDFETQGDLGAQTEAIAHTRKAGYNKKKKNGKKKAAKNSDNRKQD